MIDQQAEQEGAHPRKGGKENTAFAQLRASTQTEQPGQIGQDISQKRKPAKQDTPGQTKLFGTDVSKQFKGHKDQKQPDPEREQSGQPGQREILSCS